MPEHRKSHEGTEALYKYLNRLIVARNLYTTIKQVTKQCRVCLQSNPKTRHKAQLGQIGKVITQGSSGKLISQNCQEKGGFDTC